MKSIKKHIVLIALILGGGILFNSCMDEIDNPAGGTDVKEGIPVTITLPYGADSPIQVTKSGDNAIYDLYLLEFDHNGKFINKHFRDESQLTGNTIKIETTTGKRRLFALANVGANNFNSSATDFRDRLDAYWASGNKTLNDWLAESATMVDEYTGWSTLEFLMSGRFSLKDQHGNIDATGLCLFTTDNNGKGVVQQANGSNLTNDCKIWLERTIASVTFNIAGDKDIEFSPISWEIHNLPRKVFLYDDYVKDAGKNSDGRYYTTQTFTPKDFDGRIQNATFQFYMLENRQQDVAVSGTGSLNDLRKTNAPANAAYIVLKGYYEGKEKNPLQGNQEQMAKANVTYYIPLGFVYGNNPANDFSVRRNHKYTYNIMVKSVNSVIVEAIGEDGKTSSTDGDVVFSDKAPIEVDAHYSRILLTFKKGEVFADANGKYISSVRTAKNGWMEKFISNDPAENDPDADIHWVHFVKKTTVDSWGTNGPKYGPYFHLASEYRANGQGGCLLTIRELMNELTAGGGTLQNDVSYYAYIAEHTYDQSVKPDQYICYRSDMLNSRTRTMKFGMHKAAYRDPSDPDYNSSVSSASYVINQLPIVSIFDMNNSYVLERTFWGLECVNENVPDAYYNKGTTESDFDYKAITSGLQYGLDNPKAGRTDYDGRVIMKDEINSLMNSAGAWKNPAIIGATAGNLHTAKAYAACMSRNRDKNGDGRITDDEIEWYLPSIDQYQHFWVGTNAVPEQVTLYPKEIRDWNYSQRGKTPLQQRETFAYYASGGHSFQADEGSAVRLWKDKGKSTRKKHVRCARNIVANPSSPTAQEMVTIGAAKDDYGFIVIEVNTLTAASLRPDGIFSNRTLPSHNEYDPENRLFSKIAVRKLVVNTTYKTWIELANDIKDKGLNPCSSYNTGIGEMGGGWRPPNQRELILITTIGTDLYNAGVSYVYFGQTYSSMWDWTVASGAFAQYGGTALSKKIEKEGADDTSYNPRYGYVYTSGLKQMQLPYPGFEAASNPVVRCVKDMR